MPWLKYSVTRRSRRSRRELAPLECQSGATVAPAQVADIGVPFCPRRPEAWSSAAWWAPGWPPRPAPRVRVRTLSPTKPSASPAPRLRAMPGNSRRYCHRHRRRHRHPPARPASSAAARKAAARAAPSTPSAPHPNCKSPTCPPTHARYLDIATVCDRADTYALGPPYLYLYVRAARSSLLRTVRTRGAGQLAPAPERTVRTRCQPRAHRAYRVPSHPSWARPCRPRPLTLTQPQP